MNIELTIGQKEEAVVESLTHHYNFLHNHVIDTNPIHKKENKDMEVHIKEVLGYYTTHEQMQEITKEVESGKQSPTIETEHWHKIYSDPLIGGLFVGQRGAKKHILASKNGPSITKGYHEFYLTDKGLMGRTGAREELVTYF